MKKYNEYAEACNKRATELNQNYLSRNSFRSVAKSLGVDWKIAKGWVNGVV